MSLNKDGLYSSIVTVFPKGLMNTSVSATLMNGNVQARRIDNITPSFQTAGAGRARYGFATKGNAIGGGVTIQEIMEYRKTDGSIQILAYTSDGKVKLLNEGTGAWSDIKTGLNANGTVRYTQFKGKLIVVNGFDQPFSWDGSSTSTLQQYLSDFKSGNPPGNGLANNPIHTSTSAFTIQPGVGRTNTDYPNGRSIQVSFTTYTNDAGASAYAWISSSSISFKPAAGVGPANYPAGTYIKVTFTVAGVRDAQVLSSSYDSITGILTINTVVSSFPSTTDAPTAISYSSDSTVTATVSSTSYNSGTNTLTVNVTGTPFPAPTGTITQVKYQVQAPILSDIFTEHNRLWGLSGGQLKAGTYRGSDGMKVYFTYDVNNENNWYSPITQNSAYIDLSGKSDTFDELVRVRSFQNAMVFLGRNQAFIYTGDDPTTVGGFIWQKTIDVGTVHGSLVCDFPNDLLMVTKYGARSISNVFQTGNLQVKPDLGSDIDATFNEKVITLQSSDGNYAKARSGFYDKAGIYWFKMDDTELLVYGLSENAKGWVFFTGLPAQATAYKALSDGRWVIGYLDQLYVYGNGADSTAGIVYTDNGASFKARWWTSWKFNSNKRWANRRWQLIMEESANVDIKIRRVKDWDTGEVVDKTITLSANGPFWGTANWDADYWQVSNDLIYSVRDNFISSAFSFIFECDVTTGPLSVLGLKAIGG